VAAWQNALNYDANFLYGRIEIYYQQMALTLLNVCV